MNVYLDDMRKPPSGWYLSTSVAETIRLLEQGVIDKLSLDHDLGACEVCMQGKSIEQWMIEDNFESMPNCEHVGTGYDVLLWIEEEVYTRGFGPPDINIHTANPVARTKMEAALKKILSMLDNQIH